MYERLATEFQKAHESVRKIVGVGGKGEPTRPPRWRTEFKQLHKTIGDLHEVETAVRWYCRQLIDYGDPNNNGRYLPVIWGPRTFAKKWEKLQDAMQRHQSTAARSTDRPPQIDVRREECGEEWDADEVSSRIGL